MNPYWRPYGGPGYELVRRAEDAIERHGMLEPGDAVVVAVSGGPDSICLLDVLARLGEKWELDISVAHVDHGLSEGSDTIAAEVTSRAAKEGYEVHLARAPDLDGPNLHARARDFRYEFLEIVATRESARRIATGHTLDDRVETTLARLLHGAGTSGLAGLPPRDRKRIRPLIHSRRAETRAYCEEVGLEFVDDPANEDLRFERPAIRSKVVAGIEEQWGDGAIRAIARSSERLREDADALDHIGSQLYADGAEQSDGGVTIGTALLIGMPRALRRRVLELSVGPIRDRAAGIDAALDALDAIESGTARPPLRFSVAGGAEIVVEAKAVEVVRVRPDPPKEEPV